MKYNIDFSGKTVLITGAAGGIGSEVARGFLANNATVFLTDYNEEQLINTKNELQNEYPEAKIISVCADITSENGIAEITAKIKESQVGLDVLINNAGCGRGVYSTNETMDGFAGVIALNLTAQFFVSQAIAKEFFIPAASGVIVNMCSLSALIGVPNAVAYSSSKGGLLQMTKSLAGEWARYNIRVNCVCPGFVDTPLIYDNTANEKWMNYMNKRIPQHRLAVPEDITGSVLFLASGLAEYVTGTYIIVDGGYSGT